MAAQKFDQGGFVNYLIDIPVRGLFGLFSLLPYRQSLAFASWVSTHILAPPFGVNRRIRSNLKLVWPDMAEADIRRLCHEVTDSSARVMVESARTKHFIQHASKAGFGGPGKDMLLDDLTNARPVVLVSGHFGNYQVLRVLLKNRGFDTAAIYRPMNNAFTNKRYIDDMNQIAGPNYPRGMAGTKSLLSHLRKGGAIAMLNDQGASEGKELQFMGHPAWTMTSAAEFALKYKARIYPYYGIRCDAGLDFDVVVQAPVNNSDPVTMTQALNDSLEEMVRTYPGQWFWIHRRWKRP